MGKQTAGCESPAWILSCCLGLEGSCPKAEPAQQHLVSQPQNILPLLVILIKNEVSLFPGSGAVDVSLGFSYPGVFLTFLAPPAPPAAGAVTNTSDVVARDIVPTVTELLTACPKQPLRTSFREENTAERTSCTKKVTFGGFFPIILQLAGCVSCAHTGRLKYSHGELTGP